MTALLVPMALDVLVVRADGSTAAPTAMTVPSTGPASPTWRTLTPAPFGADIARPRGAYLMWSLPDGLTQARPAQTGGTPAFGPIPQRWLILRLSGDVAVGPRNVAAWLLADIDASPRVQVPSALSMPWPAPVGPSATPLTALGSGDLAWSGYYDNVAGVLGFYDSLDDVANGSVSYLVCGWYLYPQFDPLTGAGTDDDITALGWALPDDYTGPVPTSTLVHGSAVGFGWPSASWPGDGGTLSTEAGGSPDPDTVQLALADTIVEAGAALGVGIDGDDADPTEQLLVQATLGAMLSQLASSDGPASLDTTLHASRFQAQPSASTNEAIWAPTTATSPPLDPQAPSGQGAFLDADRSAPRVFAPVDPVIMLGGAGRSYSHGGDGRFTDDGTLACRPSGATVTWAGAAGSSAPEPSTVLGTAQAALDAAGAPGDVWDLLLETASLDPSGTPDLASATASQPSPDSAARAAWLTDPNTVPSVLTGTLPSAVAIHGPELAWTPMHVEWAIDYAAARDGIHAFTLGAVDFELSSASTLPATVASITYQGRSQLSSAPAAIAAGGAAQAQTHLEAAGLLGDHPVADELARLVAPRAAAGGRAASTGATGALADQDLLSGSLQDLLAQISGRHTGVVVGGQNVDTSVTTTNPTAPNPIRAGLLTLSRARVVDAFGQVVDLVGSGAGATADLSRIAIGSQELVDGAPGVMELVPRFNAPARVMLRWVSATGDHADASTAISPLCGFFVPSPLDGSVEFFDAAGNALGRLRPDDTRGTVWEEDPGEAATLGGRPSDAIPNQFLGAFADALLAADTAQAATSPGGQTGLRSLSLLTDATRWTISPSGSAGDEHLALLLGRPVAVLRAGVKIDVQYQATGSLAPLTAVPVKLGTLAHTQDGVLGYFVDDDYTQIHAVDPALGDVESGDGETISSPYVDLSPSFGVQPGVGVDLTIFAEPATEMHGTVGLLPQKDIGMRRDWVADGLAKLTPNWRYGPVLIDPKTNRIPIPTDIHGQWSWSSRRDQTSWLAPSTIVAATGDAVISDDRAIAREGWISVILEPDPAFHGIPFQVTNVTKPIRDSAHRIQGIGACRDPAGGTGSIWWLKTDDAITMVTSGRFFFFVLDPDTGDQIPIIVATGPSGRPFLQTVGDNNPANNLNSLPEMPAQGPT
jgi:hypothetical protein